ncbi:MAG TPA: tetratricopeptide repeat protein, partial [Flavobacteriales bacterium]|nr:tetratricopeptide repeat protein [Flavobacteriales bacterium]
MHKPLPSIWMHAAFLSALLLMQGAVHAQTRSAAEHLELARKLLAVDVDSALLHAEEAERHLGELATSNERVRALITLGDAQEGVRDLPAALDAYQRAQTLVDEALEKEGASPELTLSQADVRMNIGLLHFNLRNAEKSIACYTEALRILDQAHDLDTTELARRKVRLFNNLASVYVQRADFATALPYFEQAALMNRPLNEPRNESSLNNNIGICLMEMGEHVRANEYFLKSLAVRKQMGDQRGQAQVLNNLGKNQVFFGRFEAARDHFEQALAIGRAIKSRESMVISLESLSLIHDTLRNYEAALDAHREFKALNDSLYNADTRLTIARLEEEFRRDKERAM